MPKILQYQPDQVQTQVVKQPTATTLPASAFGNPIAEGAFDLIQAGLEVKKRIDTTSAEEALVKFERDKNDTLFNPESGYFNTAGRNAYDNSAAANKSIDELKKTYGEDLSQQAKLMFDGAADKHITRSQMDIARHASKGLKTWEIGTLEAQVENSVENASLYWGDKERLKVQNIVGRQAIFDSAKLMGLGFEETAEKVQTFESSFAKATIEAATQSSSFEGKGALKEYGDKLEGPDKVKIETSIERKAKVEKTQADATFAVATSSKLNSQYSDLNDIREQVNKIKDPELRKKTMIEATSEHNRIKQAEKESSKNSYDVVIDRVNAGDSVAKIEATNAADWKNMSPGQRNNILSGKHIVTNQKVLADFRLLGVKEKANFNPYDISDQLKPADFQKVVSEVNAAKKGNQGSRVKSLASKSMQAAESVFGKSSKWSKKSGGVTEKGERANEFLNELQGAIDEKETELKGKITPDEENKIIAEFTGKIVAERSAFGFDFLAGDTTLDLSNTPPEDIRLLNNIVEGFPSVDKADLQDAYQFLIDQGAPINRETLTEAYKQGTR